MPSIDIFCYSTDAYVTVQIKLFVCMEGFDHCVSSFVSFILSLSYVGLLQGMVTKQTESKTVPTRLRHSSPTLLKIFLFYVRLVFMSKNVW